MTVTEINTLSDNERYLLCNLFKQQNDQLGKSGGTKIFSSSISLHIFVPPLLPN